jgi:CRP/FNR family cyclic AMP-dependent transcriptional regulator
MSNTTSKLWHLESVNIFKDFSIEELAEVDKRSTMRSIDKDVYIYFPHDPANVVFLLKSGRVKIGNYSDNGKEVIKTIIYPGEIFGELAIAGQSERTDFAKAMDKDVKICAISKEEMVEILSEIPRLNLKITETIGDRIQQLDRKFESLVFHTAEDRIIAYIRKMAIDRGIKIGHDILIKHNLSHQDIANLTATSRQTVTTVFNQLKKNGTINFERKRIMIYEFDELHV